MLNNILRYKKNYLIQSVLFTLLFQILLFILYLFGLIYYNPLFELSDLLTNFIFIFFSSLIFLSPLFSFILIFLIYIVGVFLYYLLRINISISILENIPELLIIYSPQSFLLLIFISILVYFIFRISIKINFVHIKNKSRIFLIFIYYLFFQSLILFPHFYFNKIKEINKNDFNRFAMWRNGGQLYSIGYIYLEDKKNRILMNKVSNKVKPIMNFAHKPNSKLIAIIMLESFVSSSEIAPEKYDPLLKDYGFESIIMESPSFGGLSAKSEFEILCGLPELQILGEMTFNYFGGKKTDFCLPRLLSNYNFSTVSIFGTHKAFHNAKNAYSSIGFNKIISKNDLKKTDYDGIHPSDKTLFDRAFNEILKSHGQPIFLYIFTAAGHHPYYLNDQTRPRQSDNLYLDRVRYTELELEKFINQIDSKNIQSSIIILGDHATKNNNFKRNPKLLNVWFRSNFSHKKNINFKNCTQYYEISKFITGQNCNKIFVYENEIIGRDKNFPNYNFYKNKTLALIKSSLK